MALETAQKAITDEIARLKGDVEKLETALRHLSGRDGRPPSSARKPRSKPSRAGRRTRMSPEQRQEQLLSIIKQRPGITPGALAKEAGVTPSYVSGLIKTLVAAKKVKKADGGLLAR